jgi:hypothetical protein
MKSELLGAQPQGVRAAPQVSSKDIYTAGRPRAAKDAVVRGRVAAGRGAPEVEMPSMCVYLLDGPPKASHERCGR